MSEEFNPLKLENQLCFPLYACAREIIKKYRPFLDKLDLTYTQYIVMLVLWDKKEVAVRELCKLLYLDSGTLTPVLKNMESKGLISRQRSQEDERVLIVQITEKGAELPEIRKEPAAERAQADPEQQERRHGRQGQYRPADHRHP